MHQINWKIGSYELNEAARKRHKNQFGRTRSV